MKKLITIGLCLLLVSIIPNVIGLEQATDEEPENDILMVARVFGFFPRANSDYILYLAFPQFQTMSIPKDCFEGYIGRFIISGIYNPNPWEGENHIKIMKK